MLSLNTGLPAYSDTPETKKKAALLEARSLLHHSKTVILLHYFLKCHYYRQALYSASVTSVNVHKGTGLYYYLR